MRIDRTRLSHGALALTLGAAPALICLLLAATDATTTLLLSSAAVAGAAWLGSESCVLATLGALLSARIVSHPGPIPSVLFAAEGLLIAAAAARGSALVRDAVSLFASSSARIRALLGVQRRLHRSAAALSRLEGVSEECASFVIDERDRVVEWGVGASRLFGYSVDAALDTPVARLLETSHGAEEDAVFATVSAAAGAAIEATCRRSDGSTFDGDVTIHAVREASPRARVVTVRDRTRDQEWRAFADGARNLQVALREEADIAQRQLATLQYVTEPELNSLSSREAIQMLLDRLREAIDADGVALVRSGRQLPRLVAAAEGLQPEAGAERARAGISASDAGRILIVHNDPARVAAASAARWCDQAASLITVPVRLGSHIEGTVEAVGVKTRRSTEWEIALVQVVASQIAGRLRDQAVFNADAVA